MATSSGRQAFGQLLYLPSYIKVGAPTRISHLCNPSRSNISYTSRTFATASGSNQSGKSDHNQISDRTNHLKQLQLGLESVIGHDDAKQALVLGLVSQEHVYIEGPPGVGKTMLAELAASLSALRLFSYQMHRDTRLAELVGDSVIIREADRGDGEVIRHAIRPGGLLKAEVCVLDDISRAPGEALNVLLRILNERMFGCEPIPRLTAIATGNPVLENYYVEPLDPANLDRFTLQVRAPGLIQQDLWEDARRVVELGQFHTSIGFGCAAAEMVQQDTDADALRTALLQAHEALWDVQVGPVGDLLLRVLQKLKAQPEVNERNSLLSDRTFLVKIIKVMRANAILHGRTQCLPEDLFCIRLLTTFRLPTEVHERIPGIVEDVLRQQGDDGSSGGTAAAPGVPDGSAGSEHEFADSSDSALDCKSHDTDCSSDCAEACAGKLNGMPKPKSGMPEWWFCETAGVSTSQSAIADVQTEIDIQHDFKHLTLPPLQEHADLVAERQATISNLGSLLRVVEGSVERGSASQTFNGGGSQRQLARLRSLADFCDADACDLELWTRGELQWPHALGRQRRALGGQLVICRDVSRSMQGWRNEWAAHVSCQLISLAKRHGMRIGYVEFSHVARKYVDPGGAFLSREYDQLVTFARVTACGGSTNYQVAMKCAMSEWEHAGRNTGNRHILFLTDGWPTVGDRAVAAEREQARVLGVRVHTVYIGCPWTYPTALHQMSQDTKGAQFSVYADPSGANQIDHIRVEQRDPTQWILHPRDLMDYGPTLTSIPLDEVLKRWSPPAPTREEIWWRAAAEAAI